MNPMKHTTRRPFDALDQDQRVHRARVQAGDYEVTPHDGSYIVAKLDTGEAYIVTAETCSCADWEHRIRHCEGARCKHQSMVGAWLLEQGLSFIAQVPAQDDDDYVDPLSDVPAPAGPEEMSQPVALTPEQAAIDAAWDRIFGED